MTTPCGSNGSEPVPACTLILPSPSASERECCHAYIAGSASDIDCVVLALALQRA